jgi:hypothetical protein
MDYRKLIMIMDKIKGIFEDYDEILIDYESETELFQKLSIVYIRNFDDDFDDPINVLAFKEVIHEEYGLEYSEDEDLKDYLVSLNEIMAEADDEDYEDEVDNEVFSYSESNPQEKGFIYVLMNPSMEEMLKIGKTNRDPETRMNELSKATGVPTPFVLVYKELFNDCSNAEKVIHEILEMREYRVSSNREFFSVPIHEAISLIQDVKKKESSFTSQSQKQSNNPSIDVSELSSDLFEQADNYYYGLGDSLQNEKKALELYKKAAKLGNVKAYAKLGNIYCFDKDDGSQALDYYNQAIKLGDTHSYIDMANIYENEYYGEFNLDNAYKCWNNFMKNYDDNINEFYSGFVLDYMYFCLKNKYEIKYRDLLSEFRSDLLIEAEKDRPTRDYTEVLKYIKKLPKGNIETTPLKARLLSDVDESIMHDNELCFSAKISEGRIRFNDKISINGKEIATKHIYFNGEYKTFAQSTEFTLYFNGNIEDYSSIKKGDEVVLVSRDKEYLDRNEEFNQEYKNSFINKLGKFFS